MDAVQRWLTVLGLLSAALAGLGYISRQIWRGFRLMERLSMIVQHELSPNTGSSMKDDVATIARAVGVLQRDVADLTENKESAHQLLQVQLDTVVDALGLQRPQHRREEGTYDVPSNPTRQDPGPEERRHRGGPVRPPRP